MGGTDLFPDIGAGFCQLGSGRFHAVTVFVGSVEIRDTVPVSINGFFVSVEINSGRSFRNGSQGPVAPADSSIRQKVQPAV